MAQVWNDLWRGLALHVELRGAPGEGGSTLRVKSRDGDAEWLRFDCFEENPHWHLDPSGRDEVKPLDERGDVVAEVFDRLKGEALELLRQAGAPKVIVDGLAEASSPRDSQALQSAEIAMRHRPARLEELDIRTLRTRRSQKWHTYPADVLPAWVAEMDFPIAAPIQAELRRFTETADAGYPIGLRETGLAELFCERMSERFDWSCEPSRVEILSEVVQGMYLALEAYSEPGQGVLVQTPIYPPFLGSVRETGRRLVENRMSAENDRLEFDFDGLSAKIDPETRLFLFCNPHNPSGRVLTRSELERIAALAIEHDLIVVSDEIHADLLFDGRVHIPLASLGPEIAERTVTLNSASKSFNIPGLRCAIAHFGSATLQRRFNTVVPRHIRGGLGLHGLYTSIAAWRFGGPWLDEVVPYLEANRDFAKQALAERIPEIRFHTPEATYLAWLDCREVKAINSARGNSRTAASPAAHFLRHGQVALSDGALFGDSWDGYVRLNFATSRPILTEVIDRMAKAVMR